MGCDVFHGFHCLEVTRGEEEIKIRNRLDLSWSSRIEFNSVGVDALSLADGNVEPAYTCSEQHICYPVPSAETAAETFSF